MVRGVADVGFLTDRELSVLVRLINRRRCLPIFQGWAWRCYECSFECTSLELMARHILRVHDPAPLTEEEELYGTFESKSE